MFACVVLIFIFCWAPYHMYFIYSYHNPSIARKAYIGHIFLFFYWLAMSNTCVNPIIYYVMNTRFRAYFNQVLCCVPNYLKQSTANRWRRESSAIFKLSFITRAQSCPEGMTLEQNGSLKIVNGVSSVSSSMPPRALGMKHSHTFGNGVRMVESSTNTSKQLTGRRMKRIESLESTLTCISEVLL